MLRIGRISYLNVEPFFHAFPWPIAESLPPRPLGDAVAEGRIDAGPLALADCLRLEGTVTRLPFGIVGPTRGQSVLLFSDRPMQELGGRRIAVTGETSTSVRLLRILLAFRDEIRPPTLVTLDEPADAALLIGDIALRLRQGPWPRRYCYDLGEEWTTWTGYPMVFASWAVRLDTAAEARAELTTVLEHALRTGLASLPAIAARRRDLGFSDSEITAYLESFRYRIEPDDEKAIGEYRRLVTLLDG